MPCPAVNVGLPGNHDTVTTVWRLLPVYLNTFDHVYRYNNRISSDFQTAGLSYSRALNCLSNDMITLLFHRSAQSEL